MIPRLYESADAPAIDAMLQGHGDVRLHLDRLVVLGDPGKPVGLLVWRPGGIVHEMHTGSGLGRRRIADSLVDFAIRDAVSQPFHLNEAIFVCDDDKMFDYVTSRGAIEEYGKRVFTLRLR